MPPHKNKPTVIRGRNSTQGSARSGVNTHGPVLKGQRKKRSKDLKKKMPWLAADNEVAKNPLVLWTFVPLIVISMICIGAGFYWLKSQPNAADSAPAVPDIPAVGADDDILKGPPVFTQPPSEIADAFISTTDPQQRLQWVRNPKEVSTHLSAYPKQALDAPVEKLTPMGLANNGDHIFERFMANFKDGGRRLVCVVSTPEGGRVDWDCYARYCTVTWPEILTNKGTTADVRVFAKKGNYYNYTYRDESKWSCYILTSPELDQPIYAYVDRETRAGKILLHSLSRRRNALQRITIQVSTTAEGLKHRQITIDRIRSIGWVLGEKDLNETWVEPIKEGGTKVGTPNILNHRP